MEKIENKTKYRFCRHCVGMCDPRNCTTIRLESENVRSRNIG